VASVLGVGVSNEGAIQQSGITTVPLPFGWDVRIIYDRLAVRSVEKAHGAHMMERLVRSMTG
jgi:hypothetical protein